MVFTWNATQDGNGPITYAVQLADSVGFSPPLSLTRQTLPVVEGIGYSYQLPSGMLAHNRYYYGRIVSTDQEIVDGQGNVTKAQ